MSKISKILKLLDSKLLIAVLAAGGNVFLAFLGRHILPSVCIGGIAVITIVACILSRKDG
jgi:hypothetical protein